MTFIMRDMTLRSLLADRRDRLERMFRTLVEHAPSVIYITDASGRIEFTNSAVERILGYAPADLRGRQILDIVHPEDRERAYWPVHERRTGERATSGYKVRFLRRQGLASGLGLQGIVFSLSSVGLYFAPPQGEADPLFSGTEGIAEDITESESLREGLSAVLPICSACRKIRTPAEGGEAWVSLEEYVRGHANAVLSHGYCPECLRKIRDS
jgi:PAS domain S-box-containing protein